MSEPAPKYTYKFHETSPRAKRAAALVARQAQHHRLVEHLHTTDWEDIRNYYTPEYNLLIVRPYCLGLHIPALMKLAQRHFRSSSDEAGAETLSLQL